MTYEEETAWLAGILEGEGSFRYTHTARIHLHMTDKDVVEKAAALMNVECRRLATPVHSALVAAGRCKQSWVCAANGERAEKVLKRILPFMGLRRSEKIRAILDSASRKLSPTQRGQKSIHIRFNLESSLDESKVLEIRSLRHKLTQAEIAKMFKLTQSGVSAIQLGKTWRHLPLEPGTSPMTRQECGRKTAELIQRNQVGRFLSDSN